MQPSPRLGTRLNSFFLSVFIPPQRTPAVYFIILHSYYFLAAEEEEKEEKDASLFSLSCWIYFE